MSGQASVVENGVNIQTAAVKTVYEAEFSKEKFTSDFGYLLKKGAEKAQISPIRILRDYLSVSGGIGRLSLSDYFLYELYDNNRFTIEEKRRFISDRIHWPITQKCCDMSWQGMTEDKWMSYQLLEKFGLRIPETVAVIDRGARNYGATRKIETAQALRDFLTGENRFPLFCKANDGLGSFGAFVIKGIDGDMVVLDQAPAVSFETLFDGHIGARPYVLQVCVENHPVLAKMTKYLATVRLVNLVDNGVVKTPFIAMKIPAANCIADNFWRKGNLLANVDVETGVLNRIIRGKGVDTEEVQMYPGTGYELEGLKLPHWDALKALNEACVSYFTPIRYNSLDIAITESGPVIVEMNTGGSFELPQLASGKGMLTDDVYEFFRRCGVAFKGKR